MIRKILHEMDQNLLITMIFFLAVGGAGGYLFGLLEASHHEFSTQCTHIESGDAENMGEKLHN